MTKFDTKKLRQLYENTPAARAILDHLASRERNWNETTVERIQANVGSEGHDISRGQVIDFYRELEKLGCGTFKTGRRGWSSRFLWSVEMVSVGRAAAGDADDVEQISAETDLEKEEITSSHPHIYLLRPGLTIRLELPTDLTQSEAQRLGTYISTLPFVRS